MFGNAWAGTAKFKNRDEYYQGEFLEFKLPSGFLDKVKSSSLGLDSEYLKNEADKLANFNFNNLEYVRCNDGTLIYQKNIKQNNAEAVSLYFDEEECWVCLHCTNGNVFYNEECVPFPSVSVISKATGKGLKNAVVYDPDYSPSERRTDANGNTTSFDCRPDIDQVCVTLGRYKKQCQTCAWPYMLFELETEADAKNTTKTESESQTKKTDNKSKEEKKKESSKNTTTKTDEKKKKSAENPVAPPAATDGAIDEDNEKETILSGEDGGETPGANETPAETENGNGTAAADDGDTSTESADDESNEDEEQNFDFSKLDKILDEYFSDSSNWKNEDGNFNTARLVSDSVAGVVLGTAGGVITSKIIKKNQIKKGFEDLKCTVGGQEVATYGDEFTVGAKQ